MKVVKHPISKTIMYGLVCGLTFVPLSLAMNAFISWSGAVCLTLWLFLSGYAFWLNLGSNRALIFSVFPLLLLIPAIFFTDSTVLFFLQGLIVVSWIRSGICYPQTGARGVAAELLLCFLGAVLVQALTPGSVSAWALGVWLFFLVQALYFAIFEHPDNRQEELSQMDAFERAGRQADRILTDTHWH